MTMAPTVTLQPGLSSHLMTTGAKGAVTGLEILARTDGVRIKQNMEALEVAIGFESANKYDVMDNLGQLIYTAAEESSICCRCCCANTRTFTMHLYDVADREVITLYRPCRCTNAWCCCGRQELKVHAPPKNCIGSVEQDCTVCCTARFDIKNETEKTVLVVQGPFCCTQSVCCGDVVFNVMGPIGNGKIGKICKIYGGLAKEALTNADSFGVTYPMDLDVTSKALLLAATFLIDYTYFESKT